MSRAARPTTPASAPLTVVPNTETPGCGTDRDPLVAAVPTSGDNDLYVYNDGATALGPPGGPLVPDQTIPRVSRHLKLLTVTRDPVSGELAALAEVRGFQRHAPIFVWTKPADAPWSDRTVIAHAYMPGRFIYTAAITAYDSRILVGIVRYGHLRHGYGPHGIVLVKRGSGGHWSDPSRLPHTVNADSRLTLHADPASGHIVATFQRARYQWQSEKDNGLLTTQLVHGHWRKATYLAKSRVLNTVTAVVFDDRARPIIGFLHG
jgi:hypothetical protein